MGVLRLLLALTVLNWHHPFTRFNFLCSGSAVFVFFIISGFLMSMVLTEKYEGRLLQFASARIIRLYPVYLVALFACYFAGQYNIFSDGGYPLPDGFFIFANQVLLFPEGVWENLTLNTKGEGVLFLGQMYTVALELMFYALAPLIVRRSLPTLSLLFATTACLNLAFWYMGVDGRQWQYNFFPATMMYFLAGSISYRIYRVIRHWRYPPWLGYGALPLIVGCGLLSPSPWRGIGWNDASVYAFYGLCAIVLPFLFIASAKSRVDRFIGDLSYPLYVMHVPAIWLATAKFAGNSLIVLALSLVFSLAALFLVDRPMAAWRSMLAARGKLSPVPA